MSYQQLSCIAYAAVIACFTSKQTAALHCVMLVLLHSCLIVFTCDWAPHVLLLIEYCHVAGHQRGSTRRCSRLSGQMLPCTSLFAHFCLWCNQLVLIGLILPTFVYVMFCYVMCLWMSVKARGLCHGVLLCCRFVSISPEVACCQLWQCQSNAQSHARLSQN